MARPSTCTVQAPHWAVSQPTCVPVSASGPLANLIAVPWVSLTVPFALLGTLLLPLGAIGETLLWLVGTSLALLFELLSAMATWQPAWLAVGIPIWALLMVGLGVLLMLLPSGVPVRALGLVLLAPLVYPPYSEVAEGRAQVSMLDVGQGLSVLVRTREHALLYDAGPRQGDFDTGERVVFPSLRSLGVKRLDILLLSHADNDHSGGAQAIRRLLPVARTVSGEPQRHATDLNAKPCENGAEWRWNGVRFSLWQWQAARESNQTSCVLLVEANGERVLLTGDIDQAAERALLASGRDLRADWLQVPHHGSGSSSSPAFLQAVAPRAVLLSRGRYNAYGHPHPQVLARYRALGAVVYDNVPNGTLRLLLGQYGEARGEREQRYFWR